MHKQQLDSNFAAADLSTVSPATSTSAAILQEASEQFAKRGFAETSMRDIASSVGVQAASIYSHFSSKEEILWQIIRETTRDLVRLQEAALAEVEGPYERLRTFAYVHARYHAERPRQSWIANVHLYSLKPAHFEEVVEERHRYTFSLQLILRAGRRLSLFDVPDISVASHAILQMGIGIAYWYKPNGPLTPEAIGEIYRDLAVRTLSARTSKPAPPARKKK